MYTPLCPAHQQAYDAIHSNPLPCDLAWRDVRAMLRALAVVGREPSGAVTVTCNGHVLVLHAARDGAVASPDDLRALRDFLERSMSCGESAAADGLHLLAVIDRRHAWVYRTDRQGLVPQRITPHTPAGPGRRRHALHAPPDGAPPPALRAFHAAVASALDATDKLLVFAGGRQAGQAMEDLLTALRRDHVALADRLLGSMVLDVTHPTADHLLAHAPRFYAMVS